MAFLNKAIKFVATFRDDMKLIDKVFRHFAIVFRL